MIKKAFVLVRRIVALMLIAFGLVIFLTIKSELFCDPEPMPQSSNVSIHLVGHKWMPSRPADGQVVIPFHRERDPGSRRKCTPLSQLDQNEKFAFVGFFLFGFAFIAIAIGLFFYEKRNGIANAVMMSGMWYLMALPWYLTSMSAFVSSNPMPMIIYLPLAAILFLITVALWKYSVHLIKRKQNSS